MLFLFTLLGCGNSASPDDVVVTPPPLEGSLRIASQPDPWPAPLAPIRDLPLPRGQPTVKDCFGRGGELGQRKPRSRTGMPPMGGGGLGSGRSGFKGGPISASPPPPPTAALAPAPAAEASPADEARPKPAPAVPTRSREDRRSQSESKKSEALGGTSASEATAAFDLSPTPVLEEAEAEQEPDADVVDELRVSEKERPQGPSLDWGATVHLSNDDSMSLASAQRVLYALDRGVSLSASEVRPHELLNYFSFDTAGAPDGAMFSVLGAAEQQGDTLTVSLAVHGANPPRQPMDLTVLLDRSCSMQAEGRMEYTKRGLSRLSDQLQRGDRLDLVLFDSGVCTSVEGFVVGRDDPSLVSSVIEQLAPVGGTNLDAGLQEAYRVQRSREPGEVQDRNRRVMLITDALLNTGNVDQHLVSEVAKAFDEDEIRLTGIGVGRDFNDTMLDLLTEKGKGAYVYLGSEAVVDRVFGPGFDSLTRTIAHDVRFSLDLPPSLAMERFYGEEASTNPEDIQPIHYYAGTTQLFLQDLKLRDGRPVRSEPVKMRISYRNARTGEPEVQELHTTVGALVDGDSHNLRKGLALMAFSDLVLANSMGASACGEPLGTYQARSSTLGDDAEIAYVNGLVGDLCGVDLARVVGRGVPFKVNVDADIPISEVELQCENRTHISTLSGSDTVAGFGSVKPGLCTLKLQGTLPMQAAVRVSEPGGTLRCVVRGGRLACS